MIDVLGFVKKLQEHAIKRKVAVEKIRDLQFPIALHLIKIAVYPHHRAVNHWIYEVLNWLTQISLMQIKGQGLLKEKQYFELLYDEPLTPLDVIKRGIKSVSKMYKDTKPCIKNIDETAVKIDNELKKFFKAVSKDLASGDFDYDKYEEMLKDYRKTFLEDCKDG